MINYMKSELYRLTRKKSLHITSAVCLLLIIAAALVLYYTGLNDPGFPYANSSFFYSNLFGYSTLVLIVALLFNLALTGKDISLIKQSISFGFTRNTIFWSKLILTLSYFLIISVIGILLMIGLGESLFGKEENSVSNFLIGSFNMLPVVLSGFFMIHAMKMLRIGEVYIILMILLVFAFSGDIVRAILRPFSGLDEVYRYMPSTQLYENLMNFMNFSVQIEFHYWITCIILSGICLLIGSKRFVKQDIN